MKLKVTKDLCEIKENEIWNVGDYNVHIVQVELSPEFNGLVNKVRYFVEDKSYDMLITDNVAQVPYEATVMEGTIKIGVYGYDADTDILVQSTSPVNKYITSGTYTGEADNTQPLTPTDKEQMETAIQKNTDDITDLQNNKQNVLISGENIKTINNESILGEGNIEIDLGPINYDDVQNKPTINNVELYGSMSLSDLGIQPEGNYATIDDLTEESRVILTEVATSYYNKTQTNNLLNNKQNTLISGQNIKTINNESILGEGNITIQGGGSSDYEDLENLPKINSVELSGNKSLNDLGIQPAGNYALESDMTEAQNDIEALQTENERLKATLPTTTGEGQDVTLDKTAEMEFVKPPLPRGNSEQESTTGKNLLKPEGAPTTIRGVSWSYREDGAVVGERVSSNENVSDFTLTASSTFQPGSYIYSCFDSESTPGASKYQSNISINGASYWGTGNYSFVLNEVSTIRVVLRVYPNFTGTAIFKPMIRLSSIQESNYEPYTGGIPSPNPDYPQEIYSVGDNVNLFDKTTITENARFKPDGTIYRDTNYFATDYIPVKVNTRYTANSNFLNSYNRICYYNDNKVFISANDGNDINYFITPTGTKFVRFSKANNQLNTLKLVEGKNTGEYSAYGMGCFTVKIVNKNLFNPNTVLIKKYVTKSSGGIATSPNWSASDFIQVKPDTQYIYSGVTNRLSDVAGTAFYDETKTFISSVSSTTQTFTTPSNAKYVRISVQTETPNEIQLEQGSTATEHVAHQEQTFTFPLGNEKLMLGDYLADDGIHHLKKQIVLNGSENWEVHESIASWFYWDGITDGFVDNAISGYALSDYFTQKPYSTVTSLNNGEFAYGQVSGTTIKRLVLKDTDYTTVADFKTWLSTNNVTIEYELVNEEITPYTAEQQQVYNLIKKALSYEEQTNISGSSGEINPIFDVEAYQSTKLILENLDSRLTLVEG